MTNLDQWLISQHQKLADWAYTYRDDISPYWIAAQLFRVAALIGLAAMAADLREWDWLLVAMLVFVFFVNHRLVMNYHRSWQRQPDVLPNPQSGFDRFIRWILLGFSLSDILTDGIGIYLAVYSAKDVGQTVSGFALTMAFYFLACHPPSKMHREFKRQLAYQGE